MGKLFRVFLPVRSSLPSHLQEDCGRGDEPNHAAIQRIGLLTEFRRASRWSPERGAPFFSTSSRCFQRQFSSPERSRGNRLSTRFYVQHSIRCMVWNDLGSMAYIYILRTWSVWVWYQKSWVVREKTCANVQTFLLNMFACHETTQCR